MVFPLYIIYYFKKYIYLYINTYIIKLVKLFEFIIYSCIKKNPNYSIYDSQHYIRSRKFTITKYFKRKCQVNAIFTNLKKLLIQYIYISIDHPLFINKLELLTIGNIFFPWLKSYIISYPEGNLQF